jgi:endonuclease YncB( thermonuclease family)
VRAVVVVLGVSLLCACQPEQAEPIAAPASTAAPVHVISTPRAQGAVPAPIAKPRTTQTPPTSLPLLHAAAGGDGDSWKDTQGREYRLGMINTPEYNECYGSEATDKRQAMTAAGFRAKVYTTDKYGRLVAVVTTASGVNLNVWLARHGFADDRYLTEFRDENPVLASQLDVAFAAAKRERLGLWSVCSATGSQGLVPPPPAAGSGCHPDYTSPCVPIKGDGSGNGAANDLDCGDIQAKVTLRDPGVDPYRLDNDGDGYGCDSY